MIRALRALAYRLGFDQPDAPEECEGCRLAYVCHCF